MLRGGLGDELEARVRRGDFDVVYLATPCASYSVSHRPRLRQRRRTANGGGPEGVADIPPEWLRYMAKHNALAELSARLIIAAHLAGVAWALENPADRGDSSSDAFWRRHMDHAPIFITAVMRSAAERTSASFRTFCQCSFGSKPQKWTTIMHAQCLDGVLSALDQHICRHGYEAHEEQAHGLRPDGSSRSADSASYPPELNEFLAEALARWARSSAHMCSPCEPSAGGGRVADGPQLGESVREAARRAGVGAPYVPW